MGLSTLGVLADYGLAWLPIDATVAMVLSAVLLAAQPALSNGLAKLSRADGALFLFMAYVCIRAPFADAASGTQAASLTVVILASYYFVPRLAWNREAWRACAVAALVGSGAGALALILTGAIEITALRGTLGTLSAVGLSSTFLVGTVVGTAFMARAHSSWVRRIASGAAAVVSLWAILIAGSRGALFAAALAFMASVLILARRRTALATVVFSLVAAALVVLFVAGGLSQIVAFRIATIGLDDASTVERLVFYDRAIQAFVNAPFFGTGPRLDYPHNIFLEVLSYYGIVGGVPIFAFLLLVIRAAFLHSRRGDPSAVGAVYVAVFVGYLAQHQLSLGLYMGKWLFLSSSALIALSQATEEINPGSFRGRQDVPS
jgi:O-antigen ligase